MWRGDGGEDGDTVGIGCVWCSFHSAGVTCRGVAIDDHRIRGDDADADSDADRRPSTVDPGTLPQTRDLPSVDDPQFQAGVQDLWSAIVQDNPAKARPFFFPQSAYLQVKSIKDAASDYRDRLVAFYGLDIHAAHELLGADARTARLVGMSVPTAQAVWITPGVEQNKVPYYRVYGSRVTYTIGGRTRSFGVFSLISWRGRWYVVHLGPNPRPEQTGTVYQPRG